MTALSAHPLQATSGLPPHAGSSDRRPILWALAGALALHLAALGIPLPSAPAPQEPARPHRSFELQPFELVPPPLLPPPVPVSNELPVLLPVPFATPERLTEPVVETPPTIESGEVSAPVVYLGLDDPDPPPALPSVYPDSTQGLILPLRQPGGAEVVYPRIARLARQPGRVVLRAVISESGELERIEVLQA